MKNSGKILVIIPAYNEEKNISNVADNLIQNYTYDFLIVNDCSCDKTETICKEKNYNYISFCTNLGIGGGVQTGYQYAVWHNYDYTVQLDGDGQHNPKYIDAMLNDLIAKKYDMVIGTRFIEKQGFQSSLMRRLGIKIINALIGFCCKLKITDATSGFRVCNKRMTAFFAENYAQDYPEPEAIVAAVMNGFAVGETPVIMEERLGGKSSINFVRSLYYMIKVVIAIILQRYLGMRKRNEH